MTSTEFLDQLARYEAQIMGLVWSISSRGDEAEDLFQQIVLTMWQKREDFRPGTNFLAWACTIAKFKALEFSRNNRRLLFDNELIGHLAEEYGAEDLDTRQARRQALVRCLESLPASDRQLVEKCYQSEHTIRQAAEDLGRSVKSAYKSLARIRKALYRCIQHRLAQEGIA